MFLRDLSSLNYVFQSFFPTICNFGNSLPFCSFLQLVVDVRGSRKTEHCIMGHNTSEGCLTLGGVGQMFFLTGLLNAGNRNFSLATTPV